MKNNTTTLLCAFILGFFFVKGFCQEIPPITYFSPEAYSAEHQNWSISQSKDNYIYVANNKGLLEYNGAVWRLYPTPNETIMRSVKSIDDKIYTGFYRDFGFWTKNEFGNLKFTSLVKLHDVTMKEDEQIWEILELDGFILFKSLKSIYIYDPLKSTVKAIGNFNFISKIATVNNVIYFQDFGKGLYKIEKGKPVLVSDDGIFKSTKIVAIFYKNAKLYILTNTKGFYYLENNTLKKWTVQADQFLETNTLYNALVLGNNSFVLGSISNGVVYLSPNGDIMYKIDKTVGLNNNTVLSLFEDKDHNIWLGLDNGLNVINFNSPFKYYKDQKGFLGTVYASVVHNDKLYLGTNQGLFYKPYKDNTAFKFIKNTQGQVWSLDVINKQLFCGHDAGTFLITSDKATIITDNKGTWGVKKLTNNLILQGNYDGLYVLENKNNKWSLRNKIEGFETSSRYFLAHNSTIFVNHEYKGVFKIKVDSSYSKALQVVKEPSVKKGIHSSIIKYNNKIYHSSKKGVFKYNEVKDAFYLDTVFNKLLPTNMFISGKLIKDKTYNRLWSFSKDGLRFLEPGKLINTPTIEFVPIKNNLLKSASGFENITNLSKNNYLIGGTNSYLTLDVSKQKPIYKNIITINNASVFKLGNAPRFINLKEQAVFSFNDNNINFSFSLPNYSSTNTIKYQYKLEGYNTKFSQMSTMPSVLFENLPPGDYAFKVRALSNGLLSANTATYNFSINKPFYLSTIMLVVYGLIFVLLMFTWYYFSRKYYNKKQHRLLVKAKKDFELKELENTKKIITLKNEKLKSDIASKNRELATSTMSIVKKNEFLNSIKKELETGRGKNISKVITIIDKNLNNTDDWKMFKQAFNNADKKFINKLKKKHPELTPNDLRLCAYLRLNLSSKEIAPLLNISPRSVEVKRYRLRKKMDLHSDVNLTTYILEI